MRLFKPVEITPPQNPEDRTPWGRAVVFQFIYSIAGLVVGLACVIGGIILFLHGIVGPTAHWTTNLLGIDVSDAAPGVILFVAGLLFTWITRFSVTPSQNQQTT